jgi:hypothetical protein
MTHSTTRRWPLATAVFFAASIAASVVAPAARAADDELVLGRRHTLHSKVLNGAAGG